MLSRKLHDLTFVSARYLEIKENESYKEYSKNLKEISNEAELIGGDVADIALRIAYREGFLDAIALIRATV